ncbi:hypothetical protein KIW84_032540 [Lathyrus oleraceus]|uniref:Uncharacterized protein n=1 Tax=Pisum sativum TaxID=3888 RepID=A0A9D4XUJ4_PEA|nr:hypothetical protein KIW84_032540 [Pisum sativum]
MATSVTKLDKWQHRVMPMPRKRLDKEVFDIGHWRPTWSVDGQFQKSEPDATQADATKPDATQHSTTQSNATQDYATQDYATQSFFGDISDEVISTLLDIKTNTILNMVEQPMVQTPEHRPAKNVKKTCWED